MSYLRSTSFRGNSWREGIHVRTRWSNSTGGHCGFQRNRFASNSRAILHVLPKSHITLNKPSEHTLVEELVKNAHLIALEWADVKIETCLSHDTKLPLELCVLRFKILSRFDNEQVVQVLILKYILVSVLLYHQELLWCFREITG